MKLTKLLVLLTSALGVPVAALAQSTTFYSDPTTWSQQLTTSPTVVAMPSVGGQLPSPFTVNGVSFTDPAAQSYVIGPTALGFYYGGANPMTITLPGSAYAVAFGIGNYDGAPDNFTITLGNGATQNIPSGVYFFGAVSTVGFSTITIVDDGCNGLYQDNQPGPCGDGGLFPVIGNPDPAGALEYALFNQFTSSNCNGVYNSTFNGNLTVVAGQNCAIEGAQVTGNITLTGGSLSLVGATVNGNVQIQGGGTFSLSGGTNIQGNLQIQQLPSSSTQSSVCGITVKNDLQFQNSAAPLQIGGSSGCPGNNIGGNLQVQNNSAAVNMYSNTVGNNLQVQNNTAAVAVFNNVVANNLQCNNNTGISGGGNTAQQKQQQCSTYWANSKWT